MIKQYLAV